MITAIIVLSVIVFFVILLFLPIIIKLKVNYNLLCNDGVVSSKIFGFRLVLARVIYHVDRIEIVKKNKSKVLWLKADGETLVDIMFIEIIKRFRFTTIKAYANVGLLDFTIATGVGLGVINSLVTYMLGVLRMKKDPRRIETGIYPSFIDNKMMVSMSSVVCINLLSVIVAFLVALSRSIKRSQNNGQRVSSK